MSTDRSEPVEPLPEGMQGLLATFAADEVLPDEARARIWKTVSAAEPPRRIFAPMAAPAPARRWPWMLGGVLAAAASVALWVLVGTPGLAERAEPDVADAAAMAGGRGEAGGKATSRSPANAGQPQRVGALEDGGQALNPGAATDTHDDSTPPPSATSVDHDAVEPPSPPPSANNRIRAPAKGQGRRGGEPPDRDPEPAPSTLAAEQILIAKAWGALTGDNPARALALASEHARKFADGVLVPERAAVVAIAKCRVDPSKSGETLSHFITAHAGSPMASRVRQACMPAPIKVVAP